MKNISKEQCKNFALNKLKETGKFPNLQDWLVKDGFICSQKYLIKLFGSYQDFLEFCDQKIKRRTKRAVVKNFSDYSEDINFDNIAKNYTSENCSYEKQICEIIRDTGLSEQEEFMIRSYMNRKVDCLWYADYVKKYRNEKLNKQFSRQTIYNHLLAVQTKIMKHLKEKNMIDQNFIVPLYRRGDFR